MGNRVSEPWFYVHRFGLFLWLWPASWRGYVVAAAYFIIVGTMQWYFVITSDVLLRDPQLEIPGYTIAILALTLGTFWKTEFYRPSRSRGRNDLRNKSR